MTISGFSDKQLSYTLFIRAIIHSCEQCNMPCQALLRGTGLFDDTLHDKTLVSASQIIRLLQNTVKLRRQPDTGFIIGHRLAALSHQSHAMFLQHSKNGVQWIRAAQILIADILPLLQVERYNTADGDYFVFSGLSLDRHCSLSATLTDLPLDTHKLKLDSHYHSLLLEIVFTALTALLKQWHGKKLELQFLFAGPTPSNLPDYQTHLGAQVRFGHGFNAIKVSKKLLHVSGQSPNSAYLLTLIRMTRQHTRKTMLLPQAVRTMLIADSEITLSDAAVALNISAATLKRRLKEFDLNFRQISDALRREQAVFLLKYSGLNNEQGAMKMAIADLTNFRRAVKRWTGLTPSQLRQNR